MASQVPSSSRVSWFRLYGQPFLLIASVISALQNLVAGWRDRFPDFEIFYASATALRQGLSPYSTVSHAYGPNTNPPLVIWLMQPLSLLPFRGAAAIWLMLSVTAMLWSIRMIQRRTGYGWILLSVMLITQAGILSLRLGQVAWLLMPLGALAWVADMDGRSVAAGSCLGALAYVKPFYGIFAVYLAWRRDVRAAAGFFVSFATCGALGLVAGISSYRTWLVSLMDIHSQALSLNASVQGVAVRMFNSAIVQPYPVYTAFADSKPAALMTVCALAAMVVAWTALTVLRADRDRQWAVLGVAAVLLSPLGWIYYLPIVLGPITTVLVHERRWSAAWISGALLAVPSGFLSRGHYGALATVTIGSIYFWGTVVLWWSLSRYKPGKHADGTTADSEIPGASARAAMNDRVVSRSIL